MPHLAVLIGIGIGVFATTDIDDLFLLIGFFSDAKYPSRNVVLGQFLGIATLTGVAALCSLLSLIVPQRLIGLFGLMPIYLGVRALWHAWRGSSDDDDLPKPSASAGIWPIMSVTLAGGGDNLGVYIPLFSSSTREDIAVFALVFLSMTAVWCYAARWVTRHPKVGPPLKHAAHLALPWILLALGASAIWKSWR